MLRFTGEDLELEKQLQEALDTMLSVLQYLNASMHQVRIIGYQVRDALILALLFAFLRFLAMFFRSVSEGGCCSLSRLLVEGGVGWHEVAGC